MVRKGNLTVFEGSSISETREAPPTKIGVHVCDINLYLHEFFEPIASIKFFDDHGQSMVRKGNLAIFEGSISPKPERHHTPKLLCMYVTSISTCMNVLSQFRLIKFFDEHGL